MGPGLLSIQSRVTPEHFRSLSWDYGNRDSSPHSISFVIDNNATIYTAARKIPGIDKHNFLSFMSRKTTAHMFSVLCHPRLLFRILELVIRTPGHEILNLDRDCPHYRRRNNLDFILIIDEIEKTHTTSKEGRHQTQSKGNFTATAKQLTCRNIISYARI